MNIAETLEGAKNGRDQLIQQLNNVNAEIGRLEQVRTDLIARITKQDGAIEAFEMILKDDDEKEPSVVDDERG